jgi:AGZA family xanthine/uracil permease-like MFS transporter
VIVSETGGTCVCPPEGMKDLCDTNIEYMLCVQEVKRDLVTATAAIAALTSFCMGLFANMPIVLAPGMGLNAYFAYTVVGYHGSGTSKLASSTKRAFLIVQQAPYLIGLHLQQSSLRVGSLSLSRCSAFDSGSLGKQTPHPFILMICEQIPSRHAKSLCGTLFINANNPCRAIPASIKLATGVGIGLYLTLIGLTYSAGIGMIQGATSTPLELAGCHVSSQDPTTGLCPNSDKMRNPTMWLGIFLGGILTVVLMMYRVKGAIIFGILLVSIISWPRGTSVTNFPHTPVGDANFDFFKKVVTFHPITRILAVQEWNVSEYAGQWGLAFITFLYVDILDSKWLPCICFDPD